MLALTSLAEQSLWSVGFGCERMAASCSTIDSSLRNCEELKEWDRLRRVARRSLRLGVPECWESGELLLLHRATSDGDSPATIIAELLKDDAGRVVGATFSTS